MSNHSAPYGPSANLAPYRPCTLPETSLAWFTARLLPEGSRYSLLPDRQHLAAIGPDEREWLKKALNSRHLAHVLGMVHRAAPSPWDREVDLETRPWGTEHQLVARWHGRGGYVYLAVTLEPLAAPEREYPNEEQMMSGGASFETQRHTNPTDR